MESPFLRGSIRDRPDVRARRRATRPVDGGCGTVPAAGQPVRGRCRLAHRRSSRASRRLAGRSPHPAWQRLVRRSGREAAPADGAARPARRPRADPGGGPSRSRSGSAQPRRFSARRVRGLARPDRRSVDPRPHRHGPAGGPADAAAGRSDRSGGDRLERESGSALCGGRRVQFMRMFGSPRATGFDWSGSRGTSVDRRSPRSG